MLDTTQIILINLFVINNAFIKLSRSALSLLIRLLVAHWFGPSGLVFMTVQDWVVQELRLPHGNWICWLKNCIELVLQ